MITPRLPALVIALALSSNLCAQAPGIPVYKEGRRAGEESEARKTAQELRKAGALLSADKVTEQLARASCKLTLPKPDTAKLDPRDLYARSRKGHMRVGWLFEDKKPARAGKADEKEKAESRWRLSLSGGFVLTSDGAVVTCYHVAAPQDEESKGYLIAADDDGHVYPVTEILAASQETDTCILRVKADNLTPLPISTDVVPGDKSVCFSEPMGKRGFYSEGIVNRFFSRPIGKTKRKDTPPEHPPVWLEVSNEWAMGSSGSAVLDSRGNAIGHVSEIMPVVDDQADLAPKKRQMFPGTVIIFHDAIAAQHVLALIK